jgi:ankyrin repeat protein
MNDAEKLAEAVLAVSSGPSHTAHDSQGPTHVVADPKDEQLFHYDPNAPCGGRPILHRAAELDFSGVVATLVQHGANVNAYPRGKGTCNSSALLLAIEHGNFSTVEVLLGLGAHLESVQLGGVTPLTIAVSKGFIDIAHLLLEAGARVNAIDGCYETAFIAATLAGDLDMVELLLDHGADIDAVSLHFGTATHVATRYGHAGILQLLSDHKRNPAGISELLSDHERNPEAQSPRYLSAIDAEMLARIKLRMF